MYLALEETIPVRKCQNKRFMRKLMFLVAVSKPRRNYRTKKFFDGKLKCFPLTKQIMEKRTIEKRKIGDMITTEIMSVTKDVIKGVIINKL